MAIKVLFVERDVEYIDPMNIMLLSALARQASRRARSGAVPLT